MDAVSALLFSGDDGHREAKLAPLFTDALRQQRRGKAGRHWYVDEPYIKVAGQWQYLYRVINRDGNLVDVELSETCDQEAAEALFRSAVTVIGTTPDNVTPDKHASGTRSPRGKRALPSVQCGVSRPTPAPPASAGHHDEAIGHYG
jgi:transposase-like protein